MTLNSEKIKVVAIAIIELCLFEGISKPVSRSVGQSVGQLVEDSVKEENFKISINFLEGFMVDLKTFLGLATLYI